MKTEVIINPKICHGKPTIRDTRITVDNILELVANGYTFDRIISECYPHLTKKQVRAALKYATSIIRNEDVYPLRT